MLTTLEIVADLSYAWVLIDRLVITPPVTSLLTLTLSPSPPPPSHHSYTGYMQENIKQRPALVIKLRATFLKVTRVCVGGGGGEVKVVGGEVCGIG